MIQPLQFGTFYAQKNLYQGLKEISALRNSLQQFSTIAKIWEI